MIRLSGAIVALFVASITFAQDLNCTDLNEATQMRMNKCSYQAYQHANENLNQAYELARQTLKQGDEDIVEIYGQMPEGYKNGVKTLQDAHRAWIKFRDLSCAAEGIMYYGGSIRPLIENTCKERLTRSRTEELRSAFEQN